MNETVTTPRAKSKIFIWKTKAMVIGEAIDAIPHRHHAIQVALGVNRSFRLQTSGVWESYRAVMIDKDVLHQFDGKGDWQILLLIDAETKIGARLRHKILIKDPVKALDFNGIMESLREWLQLDREDLLRDQAEAVFNKILGVFSIQDIFFSHVEERIQNILGIIKTSELADLSISCLAESVYLSESRLIHLFKEQVGVPIRSYILWMKMMTAIELIMGRASFTTAAHQAGFADSAHLCRTFRQMFGMKLSQLFKNSKYIQLFTYPD